MHRAFLFTLSAAFVCLAGLGFSQHQECPKFKNKVVKHEVGLNAFTFSELPTTIYHYSFERKLSFRKGYTPLFIHGVMYKRTVNRTNVFRAGLDFINVTDESHFQAEDIGLFNYSLYHAMNFRVGYQRNLHTWEWADLTLFASFDGVGTLGNHKGTKLITMGSDTIFERKYNAKIGEIGLSPALGLSYEIDRQWSLSIESGFKYIYYKHRDLAYVRRDFSLQFLPIRAFSINYSF